MSGGTGKRTYLLASCTLQGGEKKEEKLGSCAHVCVEDRERTMTICEHLSQLQHTRAEGRDTSHQEDTGTREIAQALYKLRTTHRYMGKDEAGAQVIDIKRNKG